MKKIVLLLCISLLSVIGEVFAHKLVIGSRTPEFKNVQWLTKTPYGLDNEQNAPILIEFYDPGNKSSARFFSRLIDIRERYGNDIGGLKIVVLVGRKFANIERFIEDYGDDYYIGADTENGDVYRAFNVQFIPYTMLVDSKGKLYWQGNLGNINDSILKTIK